jgi:transposase
VDQQALTEYRYRAVREVLGGSPIGEVAARYGTSRQSLHTWRQRFAAEGLPGLADRSRRPVTSPSRLAAEAEVLICGLRREHPRWGARRIVHELGQLAFGPVPGGATVHRVLVRNGLIEAQDQEHKRVYRRWQRDAPMHLWQLDLVGGVPLADGRECKMVTGIDDHSRFAVISAVVAVPSGRAVCAAFTAAMRRYGVPFEVLSDNGKQFTGRHTRPQRSRCCSSGSAGRTASPSGSPGPGRRPRRGRSSGGIRPCAGNCLIMSRRSSHCRPRRGRLTGGCTPITISGRIRRWAWPRRRACSGRTARPAATRCPASCPPRSCGSA